MGARSVVRGVFASLLAIPVIGVSTVAPVGVPQAAAAVPDCLNVDGCDGSLNLGASLDGGGPFSVGYEVTDNSSPIASGTLTDGSPVASDLTTLYPGNSYVVAFGDVQPGLYVVDVDCDGMSPTYPNPGEVAFTYLAEEPTIVTCSVVLGHTATLQIQKYTDQLTNAIFGFQLESDSSSEYVELDVSPNPFAFGSSGFAEVELAPGQWSITEVADPWWRPTSIECMDGIGAPLSPDSLELAAGERYSCTFVNELGVALHVDKDYLTDPAPASTTFGGSWSDEPFEILTDGPNEPIWIPAGYNTIEELSDGYVTSAVCSVGDGDVTDYYGGASVDFFADYGTNVYCSFGNQALPVVHIDKHVDTVTDDSTFTFASSEGTTEVVAHQPGAAGPTATTGTLHVDTGLQTIFETGAAGWVLDEVSCVDGDENEVGVFLTQWNAFEVDLEFGDELWCDVYNVRGITLDKEAVGLTPVADQPGVYEAEWTVTVTNPFPTPVEFNESVLADRTDFPGDVTLVDLTATDPADNPVPNFDGSGLLGSDIGMAPSSSLTWHVVATVSIAPNEDPGVLFCRDLIDSEGGGLANFADLAYLDGSEEVSLFAYSCIDLPEAEPTIDKVTLGGPEEIEPGLWMQSYVITVDNPTDGFAMVDVYDTVDLGLPFVLDSFSVYDADDVLLGSYDTWSFPELIASELLLGAQETETRRVDVYFEAAVPTPDDIFGSGVDMEGWFCGTGPGDGAGAGLYNRADLMLADPVIIFAELAPLMSASACHDGPSPNLAVDKNIVGYQYVGNDSVVVQYDIVVGNLASDDNPVPLDAPFIVIDSPNTSTGVTIAEWELLGVDGGTVDEDFEMFADPGGFMEIAGAVPSDGSIVFHVSYTYLVDIEVGWDGACFDGVLDTEFFFGAFGGAANLVLWLDPFVAGGDVVPLVSLDSAGGRQRLEKAVTVPGGFYGLGLAYDCLPLSGVWVHKSVTNDNGGDLEPGDFTFSLEPTGTSSCDPEPCPSDPVARTVEEDVPTLVVSGDYVLSEDPAAGYTPGAFSCEAIFLGGGGPDGPPTVTSYGGAALAGTDRPTRTERPESGGVIPLQAEPSYGYDCAITNDDAPANLSITKSDGGATAIAGGAPITFTFTVTNENGFASVDATVSDELPAGWTWDVDSVVGCPDVTFAGQTMTCDVPAASLAVTGDSVEFSVDASLAADAASGDYVNMAVVDSEDDPAPADPTCLTLGALPAEALNNVACETTPAEREAAMTATKVSNASGPVSIGGTVVFTLTVTNHGPSTVLAGTAMLDDLPAGLNFISAIGSGWSCNNVDPVVCEYGADLAVGETAPPVLVTTTVASGASGTLTNTGTFTGIVDVEPMALMAAGADVALTAQPVVVTATAVASAVAVVEVRGGGTIPVTGADSMGWARLSAVLIGAGGVAMVFSRRRRHA